MFHLSGRRPLKMAVCTKTLTRVAGLEEVNPVRKYTPDLILCNLLVPTDCYEKSLPVS